MILKDRIEDIYKDYILCEEGCVYNRIDLENFTISCECKVKNNVSIVNQQINLEKSGGSSTNFEIIKCYNLVFSLKGKMNNFGFWILGFFFVMHVPILLYYFYKGIKPVKGYIFEEMEKYGYINKNKNNINQNSKKFEKKNRPNQKIKKQKKFKKLINSAPPKIKNKSKKKP